MIAAEVMVPCLSTAANCKLDWAAISAMGGWAAAIATFVAVLLPYMNGRQKDAARIEMQISDFIPELRSVRSKIRFLRIKATEPLEHNFSTRPSLQIAVVIPSIEPTRKLKDVSDALRLFQAEAVRWNVYARTVDEDKTYVSPSWNAMKIRDGLLRLDSTITRMQDAIAKVYPHLADAARFVEDAWPE